MDPDVVVVAPSAPPEPAPAVAQAAVEIAEIQAQRDITLATIHTEAADAEIEEDVAWLRAELDGLQGRCAANEQEVQNLRIALLTTQDQVNQQGELIARLTAVAIVAQEDPPLPPEPSTPEPGSENNPPLPAGGEADPAEERPPPEAPPSPAKRQRKWLR